MGILAWATDIVTRTNAALGTSIAAPTAGTIAQASFMQNLYAVAGAAAAELNPPFVLPWPPISYFGKGQIAYPYPFPTPYQVPVAAQLFSWGINGNQPNATFAGTYFWTVPAGVFSVMVNWAVAGGAAGGSADGQGNGGGGGGGGAGGWQHFTEIPVAPGYEFQITVGAGGLQGANLTGAAGGATTISVNGNVIINVSGGRGGGQGTLGVGGQGGQGGSPSGLFGTPGIAGTNDTASVAGGMGAPGPIEGCVGGPAGTGLGGDSSTGSSAGSAGRGAGSGGGGAGEKDRQGQEWLGGSGVDGYVEIVFPSQGASGGTLANDNSGYVA